MASVATWWGRDYQLMYAGAWNFCLRPSPQTSDLLGPRIAPRVAPDHTLLEKCHGIEVLEFENFEKPAELVEAELGAHRPVILGPSKGAVDVKGVPPFVLVIGINKGGRELHYLCNKMDLTASSRHEIETLPLADLDDWCGYCSTLKIVGGESLDLDWREVISFSLSHLQGRVQSRNSLEHMKQFAEEVGQSLDVRVEAEGYPNGFWVPLFYNTLRVSHGRVQFSKLLYYLATRFQLPDLNPIAADIGEMGRGWNLVRSMFVKSSLKPEDKDLIGRIASRIMELASREERIAGILSEVVKGRSTRQSTTSKGERTTLPRRRYPRPVLAKSYVDPRNRVMS